MQFHSLSIYFRQSYKKYKEHVITRVIHFVAILFIALGMVAGISAATASASGCKVYTNPGEVAFNPNWMLGSEGGAMGFTGTLYTGDSSSACHDINITRLVFSNPSCNDVAYAVVQYYANGAWHTDSQGITEVPINSPTLKAIGKNYANNTPFSVLIMVGSAGDSQLCNWPTFKLFV